MSERYSTTVGQVSRPTFVSVLLGFVLTAVVALLLTSSVHAASYSLSPASGSYSSGSTFKVNVMVNTGGDPVNTGDATITYDTGKLSVVSVSKDGSPFNLWVTEPSAAGGKITFAGGGTSAISGNKSVVSITFKAKAEGSAKVDFQSATLLAGAGQNVLSGSTGGTYTITAAAAAPDPTPKPEPEPERTVKIPPPDKPTIESKTHPEEDVWYSSTDAQFSWDIPYGVLGLKIGFDDKPDSEPAELHEPPISEWTKKGLADGVWYFHAAYKNRGGWSSSTHFRIQVDATPPEEFEATAAGGDLAAQVNFDATDALSGIALYRISVDGGRTRDVQKTELLQGGYRVTNLDPGEHTFTVTAVDMAGNEREATASTVVTGTKPVEEEVQTSGLGLIYWVSLLFMAALAVVVTMLIKERRRFHEEKDHIKRETAEAGDKLINIFGVLRDEIEEKVVELSHKPNMTDNERNILEGLKDALDISEELIDKEIEDVRKLLK